MDSKEESRTMIEYPEIETVKDDKDKKSTPKKGFGKQRFSNLAAKVITQIYEAPPAAEETIDEGEADDAGNIKESPNTTNNQNARKCEPPQKKSQLSHSLGHKVPKGKNSFASLVRLAKYKRMVSKTPSSLQKPAEEPVELPRKARFSATMSPEAQYAMLKGYEDILLTTLKTEPKLEQSNEGHLVRVKTPHHSVVSVHLNGLEQNSTTTSTESFDSEEQQSSRNQLHVWDIKPAPYHGQMYRLVSKEDSPANNRRNEENSRALLPRKSITEVKDKLVPKDKQLQLTHRFQCAMDILDKVRESKGQVVTSPRRKQQQQKQQHQHSANPVDKYNCWSREWSREFKLEYTK